MAYSLKENREEQIYVYYYICLLFRVSGSPVCCDSDIAILVPHSLA